MGCIDHTLLSEKFLMMTPSNGNIFRVTGHCAGNSPVTGEFPAQRPVRRSFDVFLDLRLNKRLSKQSRGWWFERLSRPLWRHCNVSAWHDGWLSISVFLSSLGSSSYRESHALQFQSEWQLRFKRPKQLEVQDYLRMIYTAMVFQNLRVKHCWLNMFLFLSLGAVTWVAVERQADIPTIPNSTIISSSIYSNISVEMFL